jgi:hypothetical protein
MNTRRLRTALLGSAFGALVVAAQLAWAIAQSTPTDLEARVASLEARVAELEALLTQPAPPLTTSRDGDFAFQRVSVIQQSTSSYAEVVGEVIAARTEAGVRLRATLYAEDGSIIATETFLVDTVAGRSRVFDVLMTGVHLTAQRVASIGIQVE